MCTQCIQYLQVALITLGVFYLGYTLGFFYRDTHAQVSPLARWIAETLMPITAVLAFLLASFIQ